MHHIWVSTNAMHYEPVEMHQFSGLTCCPLDGYTSTVLNQEPRNLELTLFQCKMERCQAIFGGFLNRYSMLDEQMHNVEVTFPRCEMKCGPAIFVV
jgi:hypothetical protein